jgi:hypothetical protein
MKAKAIPAIQAAETEFERSREPERAVAREGEPVEDRESMDRQRTDSESKEREERERQPEVVLAEGQRVLIGIEDVSVKHRQRVVKEPVEGLPDDPGVQVRVTRVGDAFPDHRGPWPRVQNGEEDEGEEDEGLAEKGFPREKVLRGHARSIEGPCR